MVGDGEAKVVRGASLLILLQIASRAITFIANQLLLRFLTAQLLGVSTQLEVYYLSVLFFARESLRVAIQRQGSISPSCPPSDSSQSSSSASVKDPAEPEPEPEPEAKDGRRRSRALETQTVVNLGYISLALGLVVALLLGWIYLTSLPASTLLTTPHLVPSVYIYALASVIELLSEPAFVVMQIRLQFGARATAESVATFGKCVVTLASAVWSSRSGIESGVLPFALGQAAYGMGLLAVYSWYGTVLAAREGFSLLPTRLGGGKEYVLSYFYGPTVKLAGSMMLQSFVKHILTQGDTFLVSTLSSPAAQGVYALANNYGGLAARLVFQPVEESSRSYFSRLLSSTSNAQSNATDKDQKTQNEKEDHDAQPESQPSRTALHQASTNLTSLLQLYTFITLPLLSIGPIAAPLVLSLVAGPRWTSSGAGHALAAYVYYIPLLAINGLTEAFVASVATEAQVHQQSVWMSVFSVLFAISGYVFLKVLDLGAVGLVWANGINMAGRIVWAVWFIRRYFAQRDTKWEVSQLLPSPTAVGSAVIATSIVRRVVGPSTMVVGAGVRAVLIELVKIASVAVPFLGVLAFTERRFLLLCYQAVRGRTA